MVIAPVPPIVHATTELSLALVRNAVEPEIAMPNGLVKVFT